MNCPKCNMVLTRNGECERCGKTKDRTRLQEIMEENAYMIGLFNEYSRLGASCEVCGEPVPRKIRGILGGGHWIVAHWGENHPESFKVHEQRLRGEAG